MEDNIKYEPEFLLPLKGKGGFIVPDHYFDEFLIRNEKINEFGFAATNLPKKDVKICPDDYFAKLPELILDKVKISEVLPVDNKTKFLLPEGYFKELSDKVLDRIRGSEKISIKKSTRNIFKSSWIYAVAAMFVLAVSIVVINFQNNQASIKYDLSKIDEEVLLEYAFENAESIDSESLANLLEDGDLDLMDVNFDLGGNDLEEMIEFYQ
ncbi:MAG: hypothetical protein IPN15_08060 [Saprospiraceae bacterium]|nr:hypothetical protein [Candidatus Vicinibacter affinis]